MSDINLQPALVRPSGFTFGEVSSLTTFRDRVSAAPSLGPLAAFAGTSAGAASTPSSGPTWARRPACPCLSPEATNCSS